jgi:hypothetical protein
MANGKILLTENILLWTIYYKTVLAIFAKIFKINQANLVALQKAKVVLIITLLVAIEFDEKTVQATVTHQNLHQISSKYIYYLHISIQIRIHLTSLSLDLIST